MDERQVTAQHLLAIGWLLVWRGMAGWLAGIYAILAGGRALLGFELPDDPSSVSWILAIVIAVGLLWWPVVLRMALRKRYRHFRIKLVAPEADVSAFD